MKKSTGLTRLIPYLKKYKNKIIGGILLIIVVASLNAAAPYIEGMVTTQLFADVKAGHGVNFAKIAQLIVTLVIVYIVSATSNAFFMFLLTDAIQDAMVDLRNEVEGKIRKLPIAYFDTVPLGDTLSRITNDMETISNALQQSLARIFNAILGLTFAIIMVFRIQWKMALVTMLIIVFSLIISKVIVTKSQPLFTKQQDALGALNGIVEEKYTGFSEIKLFGKQEDAFEEFREANSNLCENGFKAQFFSGLMSPLVTLVTYVGIGGIVIMGALYVISGVITVGELQSFIRYIWQINQPLSEITQLSAAIQSAVAAVHRVFSFLDEEEEVEDTDYKTLTAPTRGNVEFDDVYFSYTPDKPLIRGLNAQIKSGQMVAIVGPTGVGKTTLINLLMRFYDVTGGCIRIDGMDIRQMKREDLRSQFGMVLQDTWLFKGTIWDNIAYGKDNASKEEIIDAAKIANVHHFIKTLPEGYDMVLNEEANNVSQGEKQLLTIARAVLCNPPILILDEATSSVDTRLEQMLQDAMQKIMKGRTSFVIAHRLSTIRNADLILVMKDGNIVEQGTHKELLSKKGYYEQLYNSQFAH